MEQRRKISDSYEHLETEEITMVRKKWYSRTESKHKSIHCHTGEEFLLVIVQNTLLPRA